MVRNRAVIEFESGDDFWRTLSLWAEENKYKLVSEDGTGKLYQRKNLLPGYYIGCVHASYQDGKCRLEAWLVDIHREMRADAHWKERKILNLLLRRMGQPEVEQFVPQPLIGDRIGDKQLREQTASKGGVPIAGSGEVFSGETCWFCETRPPDESAAVDVGMYLDTTADSTEQGSREKTVKVPRCIICQTKHDKEKKGELSVSRLIARTSSSKNLLLLAPLGVVFGWLSTYLASKGNAAGASATGIITLIIFVAMLPAIAAFFKTAISISRPKSKARESSEFGTVKTKDLSEMAHAPVVRELENDGWKVGKKPL